MDRWRDWFRSGIIPICLILFSIFRISLADSSSYAPADVRQTKGGAIVVDDFSNYSLNGFPEKNAEGWRVFSLLNPGLNYYYVDQEGDGNKFLRAVVEQKYERKKKAITIIKRIFKDRDKEGNPEFYLPQDYPLLSWRWRVHKLPTGSDERVEHEKEKKSDSAAGVYVYFQKHGRNPHIIKYIWSETLPEGSRLVSPASKDEFQAHLVVIRSGKQGLGQWYSVKRNILNDFKKEYGRDQEPPRILGIGILTDADSTDTEAAADYDDIVLMKSE